MGAARPIGCEGRSRNKGHQKIRRMKRMKKRKMIFSILLTTILIYVGILAVLYIFQSSLMFFPQRRIVSTPHESGLSYDAISFGAEDGVDISAWFVPAPDSRGTILFCHGNGGNISDRQQYIEIFHRLGLNTFIFDYRGYGRSTGRPTEDGAYRDAAAAWNYLVQKKGIAPGEIVVFGESLGGAVAAWLARAEKPGALVVSSAFTSIPDIASVHYPFFPVRLLSRYRFNTLEYLGGVTCPVLIVHSCEDEIVPFDQGRRLYDAVSGPKEFLEIRGDHNSCVMTSEDSFTTGIGDFLREHLGG